MLPQNRKLQLAGAREVRAVRKFLILISFGGLIFCSTNVLFIFVLRRRCFGACEIVTSVARTGVSLLVTSFAWHRVDGCRAMTVGRLLSRIVLFPCRGADKFLSSFSLIFSGNLLRKGAHQLPLFFVFYPLNHYYPSIFFFYFIGRICFTPKHNGK